MKLRNGFVSNSSSSSFMIMGKWVAKLPNNDEELEDKGILCYESDEDGPAVGVEFDIKDDETWGGYKSRVAKTLTEAGIPAEPKNIDICSGTYYR